MNVFRYLRTVSYLKPQQIYGRVYFRIARPGLVRGDIPARRRAQGPWVAPIAKPVSMLSPTRFRFLGEDGEIVLPAQWNDPAHEKLWLYNLHYFDDLNAAAASKRESWHRNLLQRWIGENPPGQGNGWEPYPVSLRIVNWIKWALQGKALEPAVLESLVLQVRWLTARTEWHLLGNHLLANAKALVFAGLFFDGTEAGRWMTLGLAIFRRQLPEQMLSDGGHFERSPMYHAIILEDLLDLLNISRAMGSDIDAVLTLTERITRMRRWLDAMTLGDGQIAFFNDAAFGIAAPPADLRDYAVQLGLADPEPVTDRLSSLQPSGYARLAAGDAVVIADVAPIWPDYLPGHAHADTLSFEFSLGPERVVVNGGTSRYGTGAAREFERSTAAHSTVEIDSESSSEVWSGFRVGRRARVRDVSARHEQHTSCVTASHDGYSWRPGRPVHERSWALQDGCLTVADAIHGHAQSAVARFHLAPATQARADASARAGVIVLASGREILWSSSQPASLAASEWHPEFGVSVASQQIVIPLGDGKLETVFRW